MSPTIADKNSCNYRALLFLATYSAATALLLLSPRSDAYEWELTPNFRTDLIFTDNLRLVPDNSPVKKEAEFITRLMPGFYSRFTSRRFDSTIDFRLRNILYANNSNRNRSLINLRAQNTGEIIKNLFYVDANARIRQQNQFILGPLGDDANITGNLRSVRMYSVSPYIHKRFSNFATTKIRYARILTDSDASNTFFNSNSNAYQFSLISGTKFRTLEWGLNYSREDIDFDIRPKTVKIETAIANIQYNFTRRFGLTGTGGYEENTFGGGPVDDKPRGIRWSAGFIWFPTPRTSLEASVGQRFFGDTYAYNVTHRMRFMAFRSSYREIVRTSRNQFLLEGDGDTLILLTDLLTSQAPTGTSPAEIALVAEELISNLGLPPGQFFDQQFLTNRFFLEKRFTASVAFHTSKNTLLFRIYDINRKPLVTSTAFLDSLGGQRISREQQGINVTWSWRVSPRTSVNLIGTYRRLKFPTIFRRDEQIMYRISVTRRLTRDIMALLSYRRRERTSNISLTEHTENRFMASLRMKF